MRVKEDVVCVIPARGGSKGIRRKNLVEIDGLPLLAWSITAAKATRQISRVIVSTECEEIAEVAIKWGAEVPYMRPARLASDDVHAIEVVLHLIAWLAQEESYEPTGVMMLLPTSPLRLASDISRSVNLFLENNAPSVVSVVDLGRYMTNLRYVEGNLMTRVVPEENPNAQRQGLRKLFAVNGSIFLARPDVLISERTFHVEGALPLVMETLNSIDVNSEEDLALARKISSFLRLQKPLEI